jgi:CPA1 family monovalent cation:H+ antiporter
MTVFQAIAVLVTLAAALSYVNHRWLRLPTTIGLMVMAMVLSLGVLILGRAVPEVADFANDLLLRIDFDDALMHGMLGFLLFAGALHVDLGDLAEQRGIIATLATLGVVSSTVLVGVMTWGIMSMLGLEMALIHCLLFGALISPTDPIAVLGLLRELGAPRSLAAKIAGESLFNDGVGVVLFLALVGIAGLGTGHHPVTWSGIAGLFLLEVGGGALFGLVVGYLAYRMLRGVDRYQVEILISLGLVTGGYAVAEALHVSAPIAMVVAGLLIGNHGRSFAMSEITRRNLDTFWEMVDEILNAVLFVLIGLEVMILTFSGRYLFAALLVVPATLLGRLIAVGVPVLAWRRFREVSPHAIKVLTWGGLRGGISVALALWLAQLLGRDEAATHDLILTLTYVVVVFSIVVQGLTIGPLVRRWDVAPSAGFDPE